nr:MAG TPA: hypothetical protein [Caudoviricetes sp.]
MWGKHIYSSFSMIFEFFIENSLFTISYKNKIKKKCVLYK